MTTELDRLAANAPDNTEGAMVRWLATTHNTLNAQLASGVMTDEQYTEALGKLLVLARAAEASPAIRGERQRRANEFGDGAARVLGCVGLFSLLIVIAIAVLWLA